MGAFIATLRILYLNAIRSHRNGQYYNFIHFTTIQQTSLDYNLKLFRFNK